VTVDKCRLYFACTRQGSESTGAIDEEARVMAVLVVIGGVDTNIHLGGLVEHSDFGRGTVASISTNGKITVQFENTLELKTCHLPDLEVVGSFVAFISFLAILNIFICTLSLWFCKTELVTYSCLASMSLAINSGMGAAVLSIGNSRTDLSLRVECSIQVYLLVS
jgi:hypothetical protein